VRRALSLAPSVLASALVVAGAVGIGAKPLAQAPEMRTRALVDRTLRALPRYPGALRAAPGRFPIAAPAAIPASPEVLRADSLWEVPAPNGRFAVWLASAFGAHGLHAETWSFGGGQGDATLSNLTFAPSPDPDELQVEVSWRGTGGATTAARYDVMAIWQPSRPADAALPPQVDAALVTLTDPPHPHGVSATVRGAALARLAAVADALKVDGRGVHGCPAEPVTSQATSVVVRYEWPGGALTFEEGQETCGSARVEAGGRHTLAVLYDPDMRLMRAVRAALRLHARRALPQHGKRAAPAETRALAGVYAAL
jgi:hypothetical protein